ncbi:TKL protein kinase [Saprolegnia parasitica CBS 223.65]|uniref:TKL protein kinase n=1 Tax=Saprolegnia parasitica (strain CBS 223.65) TaxID=695850 RepID=A0A067CPK5_SAPPC|nr:TKL protein kinase [Saprolegnia parasitica CBS 223.65]KDO28712.1 TKL protein kinase [Saprolegnia parasitica CBS 223.65]|eukprot:XP_012200352.1 TKL protein kinase [Saprolegnia parasitica CBS 223.65]
MSTLSTVAAPTAPTPTVDWSITCPFGTYASTFSFDVPFCPPSTACLVDSKCQRTKVFNSSVVEIDDRIELIENLPNRTTLVFRGNGLVRIGMPLSQLPVPTSAPTSFNISSLYRVETALVANLTLIDNPLIMGDVYLPYELTSLNMINGASDLDQFRVRDWPPQLKHLAIEGADVVSFSSLTQSFYNRSGPVVPLATFSGRNNAVRQFEDFPPAEILDLSNNWIKLVRTIAFENATSLILDNNPVVTVYNVGTPRNQFSFRCANCNISIFQTDAASLTTLQNAKALPSATSLAADCEARNTVLQTLPNFLSTGICVVPSSTFPNQGQIVVVPACFPNATQALTSTNCLSKGAEFCLVDVQCREVEPFFGRDETMDFQGKPNFSLAILSFPNIHALTIRNANVSFFNATSVSTLENLKLVNITWSNLATNAPPLPALTSFECVNCGWGAMSDAYPWPSSLKRLSLRSNKLMSFREDATGNWPKNLDFLDFSDNSIETFEGIPSSRELVMCNNRMRTLDLKDFNHARFLDFSSNALRKITLNSVDSHDNITLILEGKGLATLTVDDATFRSLQAGNVTFVSSQGTSVCEMGELKTASSRHDSFSACVVGKSWTAAMIIGVCLGSAFVMGCIVYLVMRVRRHKLSRSMIDNNFAALVELSSDKEEQLKFLSSIEASVTASLTPHRLNTDVKLLDTILGRGAYGEVVLGDYNGRLVAVKRLREDNATIKNIETFIQEIELMSRFDSPFLVQFVGASWTHLADMKCVVEYMEKGDLQTYLEATTEDKEVLFPWRDKIRSARDMTRGLVYLHNQNVIHRDLKSRNVMLTAALDAKLGDFGIARDATDESMTNAVGTYRWTAPEVLKGKHYDTKADIYSFGMILTELDTHAVPYADMVNDRGQALGNFTIMYKVMQGKIKPTLSETCPDWLREMALECMAFSPDDRPTAVDLEARLEALLIATEPMVTSPTH